MITRRRTNCASWVITLELFFWVAAEKDGAPFDPTSLPTAVPIAGAAGEVKRIKAGAPWTMPELVKRNEPVVLEGAALRWPAVGQPLSWLVGHLPHRELDDTAYFDVAPPSSSTGTEPQRPAQAGNFTFVPYYGGHGYALEALCGEDGQTEEGEQLQASRGLVAGFCRGSGHTHERRPLSDLLSSDGPFLPTGAAGRDDNRGVGRRPVMFAKLGPRHVPAPLRDHLLGSDLARFLLPRDEVDHDVRGEFVDVDGATVNGNDNIDLDLWLGDGGWTSATHYDLQHNAYAQLVGTKRVVVAPPFLPASSSGCGTCGGGGGGRGGGGGGGGRCEQSANQYSPAVAGGGIVSHLHARHRQTFDLVNMGSVGSAAAVLRPGDVLFLPALWLHTFSALGSEPSASVSLCSPSRAHAAASLLEELALPLELEWPADARGLVMAAYLHELVVAFRLWTHLATPGARQDEDNDSRSLPFPGVDPGCLRNGEEHFPAPAVGTMCENEISAGVAFARHLVSMRHRRLFEMEPATPFDRSVDGGSDGCADSTVVLGAVARAAASVGGHEPLPAFTPACSFRSGDEEVERASSSTVAASSTLISYLNMTKLRGRAADAAALVLPRAPDPAARRLLLQNFAEQAASFVFGSGAAGVAFLASCAAACPAPHRQ
jgi:hypothetical protein